MGLDAITWRHAASVVASVGKRGIDRKSDYAHMFIEFTTWWVRVHETAQDRRCWLAAKWGERVERFHALSSFSIGRLRAVEIRN